MKRAFAIIFITGYLWVLTIGVLAHTFGYGVNSHTLMYYIVWDMFCGWNAYANQYHVVAEGVSGRYYEISESPWGDVYPHGDLERIHYDTLTVGAKKVALNYLRHTSHEPIARVLLIEEYWPKKYDFPDYIWKRRYEDSKKRYSYFNTVLEFDEAGNNLREHLSWYQRRINESIYENPRLLTDMRQNRPASFAVVADPGNSGVQIPGSSDSPLFPNGN